MILRKRHSLGVYVIAVFAAAHAAALPEVRLDGPHYSVTVDAEHGQLFHFADKTGNCELNVPLDLAGNFQLAIQQVNGTQAVVLGAQQRLSQSNLNGNTLELVWDGPLTDTQGATHDMAVHLTVDAEGDAVTFKCRVENRSPDMLAEISCPILGGLEDFSTPGQEAQCALYPPPARKTLERPFGNYATAYPGGLNMGFMDLNNAANNRGLYIGLHDTVARHKQFRFAESGQGDASTVSFSAVHFPHTKAGDTFEGSPVVFRLHEGDWRTGSLFYRDWFKSTFGLMDPSRDWIRRESFFQMIMMMLPEGNINYTFKDVPQLAKDGLKYGVRSLQLAGWQRGGHDNGYPYYEPDPRLGTWNDVAEAIEKCHKMGVKVYFFVNFQPVMMDLKWYREELGNYAALNGHGAIQWIAGWGMGTLASRMGDTVPLMAFADVSYPGMSDMLTGYFRKLAEAGADGLHVDKMFPAALDFNPRLTMGPDTSPWEGAVQLMARIDRECRAVNDDFRMSFECNWDRILQFSCATWWAGNMTTAKLVFPEVAETVGHYMPYDFLAINHDVRLGHAVMIAPYKFNRSMDVKPWRRMARYIGEVKSIRDQLTDIVYLGEALPPQQVLLPPEGLPGGVQCALWRSLKDGRRACIFTNDGTTAVEQTLLGFEDNASGHVEVYTPFEKKMDGAFPITVTIPAEGISFIVESAGPSAGTRGE
ncbi:MAG: hypothetical protein IT365_15220 [Candidatus Hydrogenedentes bacterium]|nr:hypothetical protein [Candidatus Hydrogenedentota bacterium]